jgi:hypothetical protein
MQFNNPVTKCVSKGIEVSMLNIHIHSCVYCSAIYNNQKVET